MATTLITILLLAIATVTLPAVMAYTSRTPYALIQAETFTSSSGVTIFNGTGATYVGDIHNGDYIAFSQLDFQGGPLGVKVHMSSNEKAGNDGGILFIHDSLNNVPFHVTRAGSTHSIDTWVTTTEFITWNGSPGGVRDLYIRFLDNHGESFVNIDWIQFFQ